MKSRLDRLRATKGMPIHNVIAHKLLTRRDWEEVVGAKYPANGHHWTWSKRGGVRYIGPVPKEEKWYISKKERANVEMGKTADAQGTEEVRATSQAGYLANSDAG